MEYWLVSYEATGVVRWRGQGPIGAAAVQSFPSGCSMEIVTAEVFAQTEAEARVAIAGKQINRVVLPD